MTKKKLESEITSTQLKGGKSTRQRSKASDREHTRKLTTEEMEVVKNDPNPDRNVAVMSAKAASKASSKKDTKPKKTRVNGNKKGKAFERQIATAMGHIFPDAQRELEFQAGGNRGTDIEGTDIFQFQCKRYAGYAPIGRINEVKLESENHIPVLVTQGNRMECMAVLPFEKFVTLIEIAYGLAPRLKHPTLTLPEGHSIDVPKLTATDVANKALKELGKSDVLEADWMDRALADMPVKYVTATEVEALWKERFSSLPPLTWTPVEQKEELPQQTLSSFI